LSLAFVVIDPITVDIMPGEKLIFTTHVDPVSPPSKTLAKQEIRFKSVQVFMVEAPGTAPGSATLIP